MEHIKSFQIVMLLQVGDTLRQMVNNSNIFMPIIRLRLFFFFFFSS